jgi:arylsulfatase A-like enzyme
VERTPCRVRIETRLLLFHPTDRSPASVGATLPPFMPDAHFEKHLMNKFVPSLHFTLTVALICGLGGSLTARTSQAVAPNIILLLSDDQSWNGTSVQMDPNVPNSKSDFYQTPRLEQLAASGMRFSNGYSASPVCATTRSALQSGKSPALLQMTDMAWALPPGSGRWNGAYEGLPLMPPQPEPFDPNTYSLPRIIKDANPAYKTAHYGKWHLQVPVSTNEFAVGYDFGGELATPPDNVDPWGVFNLSSTGNTFMQNRVAAGDPFFMQLSYKAVHEPVRSRDVIRQKYEALLPGAVHNYPAYAAMTEDLDTAVGMVMDKVNELGIADNTYIIYASDNGAPVAYSRSTPLRDGKATVRDGGIRVPFIVKGPGVQPGTFSDVPVLTTDLYATIAALAGRTEPVPADVEAANFAPVLFNGGELPEGMDHLSRNYYEGGEIVWHWPMNFGPGPVYRVKPSSAIRDGDYKLFVEYGENGGSDVVQLYNMVTNISETQDLSLSMPQKTAELKAKLDNYLARTDASFAYDVKAPIQLAWNAGAPGKEATGWRSTIDVQFKGRETWTLGGGAEQPTHVAADGYQPGLSGSAFSFDGGDVMRRKYFHVGDVGPRKNTPNPGTPDFDRSASFDMWFRAGDLTHNQVLFE